MATNNPYDQFVPGQQGQQGQRENPYDQFVPGAQQNAKNAAGSPAPAADLPTAPAASAAPGAMPTSPVQEFASRFVEGVLPMDSLNSLSAGVIPNDRTLAEFLPYIEPDRNPNYPTVGKTGQFLGEGLLGTAALMAAPLGAVPGMVGRGLAAITPQIKSLRDGIGFLGAETAAATGSAVGSEALKDYGPAGEFVGEIAGGLTPGLAVTAGNRVTSQLFGRPDSAEISKAGEMLGIPMTAGTLGNTSMALMENSLGALFGGSGVIQNTHKTQVERAIDALNEISGKRDAGRYAPVTDYEMGTYIQDSVTRGQDRWKALIDTKEAELDNLTGDVPVDVGDLIAQWRPTDHELGPSVNSAFSREAGRMDRLRNQSPVPLDADLHDDLMYQKDQIMQQLKALAGSNTSQAQQAAQEKILNRQLADIDKQILANTGANFPAVRNERSIIGEQTRKSTGGLSGVSNRAYAGITGKLDDAARESGFYNDWRELQDLEANLFARDLSAEDGGDLTRLAQLTNKGGKSPEQVDKLVRTWLQGEGLGKGGLAVIQRNMTPGEFSVFARNAIHRLGQTTAGAADVNSTDFSVGTFSTNFERLSDEAKDILRPYLNAGYLPEDYAGTGILPGRNKLDDFVTVNEALKRRGRSQNYSNSGLSVLQGLQLAGTTSAATGAAASGAGLGGILSSAMLGIGAPYLAAKLMADQEFARGLLVPRGLDDLAKKRGAGELGRAMVQDYDEDQN